MPPGDRPRTSGRRSTRPPTSDRRRSRATVACCSSPPIAPVDWAASTSGCRGVPTRPTTSGWQPPVNLGSGINTATTDAGPSFFERGPGPIPQLYLASARPGGVGGLDIYVGSVPGGWAGPPALVAELSSPQPDLTPAVRRDGLEIVFASGRPGGLGDFDLWHAFRKSIHEPWSSPRHLGPEVNTEFRRGLPVAVLRRRDAGLPVGAARRLRRKRPLREHALRGDIMRRRPMTTMLIGTALTIAASMAGPVLATPASGFVGTTLAVGRFDDINVFNHLVPPDFWKSRHNRDVWLSWQRTSGESDVYVQSNVWAPGGSTGWHTHPGHSLIIVTAGTVTTYEGHDRRVRAAHLHGRDGLRRSRGRPRARHPERRRRRGEDDHRPGHPRGGGASNRCRRTRATAGSDREATLNGLHGRRKGESWRFRISAIRSPVSIPLRAAALSCSAAACPFSTRTARWRPASRFPPSGARSSSIPTRRRSSSTTRSTSSPAVGTSTSSRT